MKLKLKSAGLAAIFGTPQEDCEYDAAVAQIVKGGWDKVYAQNHVDAAITAGAYAVDTELIKTNGTRARAYTQVAKIGNLDDEE